jgi:L-alanine-DL-glutamate epimerase-like enolase superfamily enzyme
MPKMEDGIVVVPDRPGLGLAFDQRAPETYGVGRR